MTVNLPAKTLDEGIKNMMETAKMDYQMWSTNAHGEQSQWSKDSTAEWDSKTKIKPGKKYIKVVQDTGVFCFIAKEYKFPSAFNSATLALIDPEFTIPSSFSSLLAGLI